jgi:hypothetical protein
VNEKRKLHSEEEKERSMQHKHLLHHPSL